MSVGVPHPGPLAVVCSSSAMRLLVRQIAADPSRRAVTSMTMF